jgi:hypothetical protein
MQQLLHLRTSVLRYMYTGCLVVVFPIYIKRTVLPSDAQGLDIPNRVFVKHFSLLLVNYNVSNFQHACKFTKKIL